MNKFLQQKEYLVTNGLGGYCSSTYTVGNTRKYHGVLIARLENLQRINVVNRVAEKIIIAGEEFPLTENIYLNGNKTSFNNKALKSFQLDNYPVWDYQYAAFSLRKSIVMASLQNKTILRYEFNAQRNLEFKLTPFFTYRNIHELKTELEIFKFQLLAKQLVIDCPNGNFLQINAATSEFKEQPQIYANFYYPWEAERGYSAVENLVKIGDFTYRLPKGRSRVEISFTLIMEKGPESEEKTEKDYFLDYNKKSQQIVKNRPQFKNSSLQKFAALLYRQAEQFVVYGVDNTFQPEVIAGYHWFAEWGRDTFISFKSLFILNKNQQQAKAILVKWSKLLYQGLIPNTANNFHALDAVFWFVIAIWEYQLAFTDWQLLKDMQIVSLLDHIYLAFKNKLNQIEIDDFAFLNDRNGNLALTWMDAKIENKPVINRAGRAVEIQALWFNFLQISLHLKKLMSIQDYVEEQQFLVEKLQTYFTVYFWDDQQQYLSDVLNFSQKRSSLTPNAIFVLTLPFSILQPIQSKLILGFMQKNFLTKVGLRTLTIKDKNYQQYYRGNQVERDIAYHQGTIWPFLAGLYLKAYLRLNNYSLKAKNYVRRYLLNFYWHLQTQNLDYVPELFEAATLEARGCISQCWSAATLIEVLYLLQESEYPELLPRV